jgi:hypothetical protein
MVQITVGVDSEAAAREYGEELMWRVNGRWDGRRKGHAGAQRRREEARGRSYSGNAKGLTEGGL